MTPINSPEYRKAVEDFTMLIKMQPLHGLLKTAALACAEARSALIRSGTCSQSMDRDLLSMQQRLELESNK